MRISHILGGTSAAMALLLLTSCAGTAGTAGGGDDERPLIDLTVAHHVGETTQVGAASHAFIDALEEYYDGEVAVEWYWSGALAGTGPEILDALADGRASLSTVPPAYWPEKMPLAEWLDPLLATPGAAPLSPALASLIAHTEALKLPQLEEEFAKEGVTMLTATTNDYYYLFCNRPINNLADAKGAIVRAGTRTQVGEIEALGMTPATIEWGELFEGLQRGTVDCAAMPIAGAADIGALDVAPYVMMVPLSPAVIPVFMNTAQLESLPEDVQEWIRTEGAAVYAEAFVTEQINQSHAAFAEGGAYVSGDGVEVIVPNDMIAELAQYREDQYATLAELAPASVEDPQAIVDGYLKTVDDAMELYADVTGISSEDLDTTEATIAAIQDMPAEATAEAFARKLLDVLSSR